MTYNINTLSDYFLSSQQAARVDSANPWLNKLIMSMNADSTVNLNEYMDIDYSVSISGDDTGKIHSSVAAHSSQYIVSDGLTEMSFIIPVDDVKSDFTFALEQFNFDEIEVRWGSYSNCYRYYSNIYNTNAEKWTNDFSNQGRFNVDNSLVFNLCVDVLGANCMQTTAVGMRSQVSGYKYEHPYGAIMHSFRLGLGSDPEGMNPHFHNINDSLAVKDSTVADRPCNVTWDVMAIEWSTGRGKIPLMVIDGSFDQINHCYFNYVNQNAPITFEHENVPTLTTLGAPVDESQSNNESLLPVRLDLSDFQIDIDRYVQGGWYQYPSNSLRYYLGDEYFLLNHGWYNTMFGNLDLGNNLFDGNVIAKSPICELEADMTEKFVNGTLIQFSKYVDEVVTPPAPVIPDPVDPIDPNIPTPQGEGEGEGASKPEPPIKPDVPVKPPTDSTTEPPYVPPIPRYFMSSHNITFEGFLTQSVRYTNDNVNSSVDSTIITDELSLYQVVALQDTTILTGVAINTATYDPDRQLLNKEFESITINGVEFHVDDANLFEYYQKDAGLETEYGQLYYSWRDFPSQNLVGDTEYNAIIKFRNPAWVNTVDEFFYHKTKVTMPEDGGMWYAYPDGGDGDISNRTLKEHHTVIDYCDYWTDTDAFDEEYGYFEVELISDSTNFINTANMDFINAIIINGKELYGLGNFGTTDDLYYECYIYDEAIKTMLASGTEFELTLKYRNLNYIETDTRTLESNHVVTFQDSSDVNNTAFCAAQGYSASYTKVIDGYGTIDSLDGPRDWEFLAMGFWERNSSTGNNRFYIAFNIHDKHPSDVTFDFSQFHSFVIGGNEYLFSDIKYFWLAGPDGFDKNYAYFGWEKDGYLDQLDVGVSYNVTLRTKWSLNTQDKYHSSEHQFTMDYWSARSTYYKVDPLPPQFGGTGLEIGSFEPKTFWTGNEWLDAVQLYENNGTKLLRCDFDTIVEYDGWDSTTFAGFILDDGVNIFEYYTWDLGFNGSFTDNGSKQEWDIEIFDWLQAPKTYTMTLLTPNNNYDPSNSIDITSQTFTTHHQVTFEQNGDYHEWSVDSTGASSIDSQIVDTTVASPYNGFTITRIGFDTVNTVLEVEFDTDMTTPSFRLPEIHSIYLDGIMFTTTGIDFVNNIGIYQPNKYGSGNVGFPENQTTTICKIGMPKTIASDFYESEKQYDFYIRFDNRDWDGITPHVPIYNPHDLPATSIDHTITLTKPHADGAVYSSGDGDIIAHWSSVFGNAQGSMTPSNSSDGHDIIFVMLQATEDKLVICVDDDYNSPTFTMATNYLYKVEFNGNTYAVDHDTMFRQADVSQNYARWTIPIENSDAILGAGTYDLTVKWHETPISTGLPETINVEHTIQFSTNDCYSSGNAKVISALGTAYGNAQGSITPLTSNGHDIIWCRQYDYTNNSIGLFIDDDYNSPTFTYDKEHLYAIVINGVKYEIDHSNDFSPAEDGYNYASWSIPVSQASVELPSNTDLDIEFRWHEVPLDVTSFVTKHTINLTDWNDGWDDHLIYSDGSSQFQYNVVTGSCTPNFTTGYNDIVDIIMDMTDDQEIWINIADDFKNRRYTSGSDMISLTLDGERYDTSSGFFQATDASSYFYAGFSFDLNANSLALESGKDYTLELEWPVPPMPTGGGK